MLLNETAKGLLKNSNIYPLLQLIETSDIEMMLNCLVGEVVPALKYYDMKKIARQALEEAVNNAIVNAVNKVNSY